MIAEPHAARLSSGVASKGKITASNRPTKMDGFFAVIGTDEGLVRDRSFEIYQNLTGGNDDGFTHETIDGTSDNSESAHQICASTMQALLTVPLFGGDKVVWLRHANFLSDSVTGRSQRTEDGVESLRRTLEQGLPSGVKFLLSAMGVDKRRGFWKFIEASAEVEVHDRIDTSRDGWQEEVAARVLNIAEERGMSFDDDALELFILLAGEQSQQISNELEKLDLYLGTERRGVTLEDVRLLVPLSRAAVVFEIGSALQKGNAMRAIELIDEQLEADESAIGIMRASIIGVVRNLYLARLIMDQFKVSLGNYGQFSKQLSQLPEAERAWLPQKKDGSGVNVFPIFLAAPQAKFFDLTGLQRVMRCTLTADQALVSTGQDHRMVLHRLVMEITAARSNKPTRESR